MKNILIIKFLIKNSNFIPYNRKNLGKKLFSSSFENSLENRFYFLL